MRNAIRRLTYLARSYGWVLDPRRLRRMPEYPIDRPIFLLGTQGGGLTLLGRMLRRHPEVISASGNSSSWASADEIQNVFGLVLPPELAGLRFKAPPHPVLTAPRSWTYAARDLYPLYRKTAADATPELRAALERVIRYCAMRFARDKGRCRFIDKSQSYTVRVGLIYELLKQSDPKFVLLPRDPYVSVYRAAMGKAADMKRLRGKLSYPQRIDVCAEHYANSMRAALEDAGQPGVAMHVVRFERLLQAPQESLRAICDFLELDFRPDMLPAAGHKFPLGSSRFDRWYPLNPDVNLQYEPKLDALTLEKVNHYCGQIIQRLGYSRRD